MALVKCSSIEDTISHRNDKSQEDLSNISVVSPVKSNGEWTESTINLA